MSNTSLFSYLNNWGCHLIFSLCFKKQRNTSVYFCLPSEKLYINEPLIFAIYKSDNAALYRESNKGNDTLANVLCVGGKGNINLQPI